ncbi:40S ribosomal S10-like protein, putative [Medicago truncatula]|uniref:40S ribosomal S10-like protein, putative n=1 Tax=Medicago truncatula TaxID=3880 RepID=G7ILT5_MEDTR|nr:40S ribosomal S10-like protein, putative [Medicago truncatula]
MDNLFNTQVYFNGGNPNLFKVRDDVTLKELKDQLDEINQRLNPEDTRRVEYVCQLELTNDIDVRSMFSIFGQDIIFPTIEMDATLLRPPEDILKSLTRPDEDV